MSITQNSKIRRITDSTLIVGADIAKKVHVARASDVRGVELGKPLTFDNSRRGFEEITDLDPVTHGYMKIALKKRIKQV